MGLQCLSEMALFLAWAHCSHTRAFLSFLPSSLTIKWVWLFHTSVTFPHLFIWQNSPSPLSLFKHYFGTHPSLVLWNSQGPFSLVSLYPDSISSTCQVLWLLMGPQSVLAQWANRFRNECLFLLGRSPRPFIPSGVCSTWRYHSTRT